MSCQKNGEWKAGGGVKCTSIPQAVVCLLEVNFSFHTFFVPTYIDDYIDACFCTKVISSFEEILFFFFVSFEGELQFVAYCGRFSYFIHIYLLGCVCALVSQK